MGMSYKKPKFVPAKASRQEQADFIERYMRKKGNGSVIYWMDGTHATHNSTPAYRWIPKGIDVELKTEEQYEA